MVKQKTVTKRRLMPPAREESVRTRMSAEFKRWVESVATKERLTVATLVELALVDRARRNEHPAPPSER